MKRLSRSDVVRLSAIVERLVGVQIPVDSPDVEDRLADVIAAIPDEGTVEQVIKELGLADERVRWADVSSQRAKPGRQLMSERVGALPMDDATFATKPVASAVRRHPTAKRMATPGTSSLRVGSNINLKGVEISNCDVLVVEGQVDATINVRDLEVVQGGTLRGIARAESAKVDGTFQGELDVAGTLVVGKHGRLEGTARYGELKVERGGKIVGDARQGSFETSARPARKHSNVEQQPITIRQRVSA